MENSGTVKSILNDFLSAYAQRDRNVPFRDWLEDKLREELPDFGTELLVNRIIGAAGVFSQKLREIEAASDLSKEEWLAEQIMDDCSALPPDTAGNQLLQIEDSLIRANAMAVRSLDGQQSQKVPAATADPVGWNEDTLKKKAREIAKQVGMAGLGVAANATRYKMEGNGSLNLRESVGEALLDGVTADPEEVKAIVAGAIRVAAERDLIDGLFKDTPVGVFCDMAGFVVEGAEAILDAANGAITPAEAAERVCKAGIAAYGCVFAETLKFGIKCDFPVAGPLAVELLGGLFDHMKSPLFADNVYTVLHDMALATWKGIIQTAGPVLVSCQVIPERQPGC